MYACDQYGSIYYFPIPEIGEPLDSNQIKKLEMPIGTAHSLLWAYNSLYVVVNGKMNENFLGSGVYRITDTDDDGELDKLRLLYRIGRQRRAWPPFSDSGAGWKIALFPGRKSYQNPGIYYRIVGCP